MIQSTRSIFVFGAVALLMTCDPGRHSVTTDNAIKMTTVAAADSFDTEGHRGCRGLQPENTWPAMRTALKLGVRTLEMDVVISRDKQVLVSHDPFFNHEITTKPDGSFITEAEEKNYNLYRMDYEEIRKYDVGLKPHPRFPNQAKVAAYKPLLGELLDQVSSQMMTSKRPLPFFNIETKCMPATDNLFHPEPAEFVELLMKVIIDRKLQERVIIQSFDFRTLQYLHRHYPHIRTAMLIEADEKLGFKDQFRSLGFSPTIYSPEYTMVTPEIIEACHVQGIRVIPWTVNDPDLIRKFRDMGVDGLISDFPNLFFQ